MQSTHYGSWFARVKKSCQVLLQVRNARGSRTFHARAKIPTHRWLFARKRMNRLQAGGGRLEENRKNARPKTNTRRRRKNLISSKVDRFRRAPINSLRGVRWNHALTKNLKSTRAVTSGEGGHFFARSPYRGEKLRPLICPNGLVLKI